MKFTDLFIRRPVLALVINLVIVIAGLQAIHVLNVRQYPRSDNASVTITTVYVGASAELVRGFITTPLERAIAAADGIDYLESQSTLGLSTINARLKLNYDPTKALAEISSKVDQVRGDLPPEAEVPMINVESADSRVRLGLSQLHFRHPGAERNHRLSGPRRSAAAVGALEGVQRADILGARTFAMRIWLKPDRMAAFNISPLQVRQALAANNFLAAVGQTKGSLVQVNLTANTDLRSVEEFKQLVIRERRRAPCPARGYRGCRAGRRELRRRGPLLRADGGVHGHLAAAQRQRPRRDRSVRRARWRRCSGDLPTGMQARVAYDATAYIDDAIREVVKTLAETLLIVIVVIFLFLGSLRSVLVPVVAIPLSLIGAVFLMQAVRLHHQPADPAGHRALGRSGGRRCHRGGGKRRAPSARGQAAVDAALLGARELVGPIIAMTITLAAVYAPIGLQGGLTGALFREFAFTLAGAVTISGVVALTLSP